MGKDDIKYWLVAAAGVAVMVLWAVAVMVWAWFFL